jgi:hypothetical protein
MIMEMDRRKGRSYNIVFPPKETYLSLEDDLAQAAPDPHREIEALGYRGLRPPLRVHAHHSGDPGRYGAKTAEELTPEVRVRVAGRLMTLRHMGKAGFAHLQQNGERLQIYVKKDAVGERDFQLFKLLDIGDIVGVEGYLFRTRTGELSIHAEKLEFLSKTLLSMPEKWHGLEDVETRYRQRYLDLIANPEVRKVFVTRARIVSSLRRQLEARGFIEVETPMMQPLYGGATGAALRHPPQHARYRPLPAHRARALPEAAGGGRPGARLRDQPQLPQRGPLHAPQPRVHHAGVLPGLHRLPRPDGLLRGVAGAGGHRRHRFGRGGIRRPHTRFPVPCNPRRRISKAFRSTPRPICCGI